MRLSAIFLGSFILCLSAAEAAQVKNHHCERAGTKAVCRIELEGEVSSEDRLFISRVHDRDRLVYRGREIGSTGSLLGREFQAGFLPRVYHLAPIEGEMSPTLLLEADAGLTNNAGIPASARIKIVDSKYPLRKILGHAVFQFFTFGLLILLSVYLIAWLRQRISDGWIYPKEELRWFVGGLSCYLILRHEVSELFVPLFWSAQGHLLAQRLALSITLWNLTVLILQGRFSDRSCVERSRPRSPTKTLSRMADLALFVSLLCLACLPRMSEFMATCLLAIPLVPLAIAFSRAVQELEWRRVFKRSSAAPLFFHLGLMTLPTGVCAAAGLALYRGHGNQNPVEYAAWAVLLLAGLRLNSFMKTKEKSRLLSWDCRELLMEHAHGSARLQALCDFVADEWGAARITVISVEDETGLVLASAGPEAIPEAMRTEPRRLGPFLRRVCKQSHILYAPVAEELGQDLQNEGLKHSSLAIPLYQEKQVRAVLCMMADEGERIPPNDAAQLEILVETLSLEILSAVAQQVAESKNQHLMNIARRADALAVEHLDHWGHFHHTKEIETRVVLGGDCVPAPLFFEQLKKSPLLGKIWQTYRTECRTLWTAIAMSFEFIPKDNRDDFWVISPREFRNPLFRELGAERVAVLLATALERHSRALAARECFSVLGYCGVRLVTSKVHLRQSTWHGSAIEIDSDDFTVLLELRQRAHPGTILFHGPQTILTEPGRSAFSCRARPWEVTETRQIFSILSATADKKEIRKIESHALEKVREMARKAA